MSSLLDAVLLVGLGPHLVDAAEGVEVVDIGRAEVDRQRLEDVGDRHVQVRALSRSIARKYCGLEAEKVVKTPVSPSRLVGRAHHLVGQPEHAAHVGALPVHELHLEAAGVADAAHRRRRHGDDEGLLDALQAAIEVADDLVGALPVLQPLLEALEGGEDRRRHWRRW